VIRVAIVEPLLPQRCCFSLTSFTKSGSVSQSSSDIEYRKWSKQVVRIYSLYVSFFVDFFFWVLKKNKLFCSNDFFFALDFRQRVVFRISGAHLPRFWFFLDLFFGCFYRCGGEEKGIFFFADSLSPAVPCLRACVCVSAILYVGTSVRACMCTYASRDERLGSLNNMFFSHDS